MSIDFAMFYTRFISKTITYNKKRLPMNRQPKPDRKSKESKMKKEKF